MSTDAHARPPKLSPTENIEWQRFKQEHSSQIGQFMEASCHVCNRTHIGPDAIIGEGSLPINVNDLREMWAQLKDTARTHFGTGGGKADRMVAQMEVETRAVLDRAYADGMKPRDKEEILPPPNYASDVGRST